MEVRRALFRKAHAKALCAMFPSPSLRLRLGVSPPAVFLFWFDTKSSMRLTATVLLFVFVLGRSLALSVDEEAAINLLDAKLNLAVLSQRYTDKHPKITEAKVRLDALSRIPVKPEAYLAQVRQVRSELELEAARLAARYSDKHPQRADIQAKLAALQKEEEIAAQKLQQ